MKTSLFDFDLPEECIAVKAAEPRDAARMLIVEESVRDAGVRDIPGLLRAGDVMVFNDTRVLPARLMGRKGEAKIEVLLHKRVADGAWWCFARPGKKLKPGTVVRFADDLAAEVVQKREDGQVMLRFDAQDIYAKLQRYGHMPLPPYIEKLRQADASDTERYQTVYAAGVAASVAAPTAGLHFTPELLAAIDAAGATRLHVTLHVGGGTFLPVKSEDTSGHIMHSEYAEISAGVAEAINDAKARGGRVIAVGTTSLRTLESATDAAGRVQPMAGETDIFITPGYRFRCVDVLMTNFHLPRSTLFMLVSAFSGLEAMQAAYTHAIAAGYRFYSYGDACWLQPGRG